MNYYSKQLINNHKMRNQYVNLRNLLINHNVMGLDLIIHFKIFKYRTINQCSSFFQDSIKTTKLSTNPKKDEMILLQYYGITIVDGYINKMNEELSIPTIINSIVREYMIISSIEIPILYNIKVLEHHKILDKENKYMDE